MSTLTLNIAGTNYSPNIDSINADDVIEQRSQCKFIIQTDLTVTFSFGQRVTVTDSVQGVIFYGIVNTDDYHRLDPQDILEHEIDCIDGTFDIDRITANEQYTGQYAGVIVADQHKRNLAAEGITAAYALDIDTTQTDFAAGTLSGTVATMTNSGDGCLQLASAGSPVSINVASVGDFNAGIYTNTSLVAGMVQPASTPALKMVAVCSLNNAGNTYSYVKIGGNGETLGTNYYLLYDIWIDPSSPQQKMAVDITFTDGSTLRDNSSFIHDTQNMYAHPNTDLQGLATGQWYHREFFLGDFVGKSVGSICVAVEGDTAGTYTAWFKNIVITNSSKVVQFTYFSSTLLTVQQMQSYGYQRAAISVVPTYNIPTYNPMGEGSSPRSVGTAAFWTSPAYSIDAAKILQSSFLIYRSNQPVGTIIRLKYSLDYSGTGEQLCTNNAPLPNLPAGLKIASRSVTLIAQFYLDPASSPNPEVYASLSNIALSINPSYSMTKTDIQFACLQASDWTQTGTTSTNVASSFLASKVLGLNQYANNFDWNAGTLTGFSTGTTFFGLNNRTLQVQVTSGTDLRVKLPDAGQYQNFTAEVDVLVSSNYQAGFVYRTTNWGNNNDSYAYAVILTPTAIVLAHGSNSTGAGAYTELSNIPLTLSSGNWHHLTIVVSGTSHKAYLDNILMINFTDGTYNFAGYLGLRIFNGSGAIQMAFFNNFGVSSTLTGTWVSPNVSLTSASTYGTSIISWRDQNEDDTNCTLLVEATINGGTNWFTCTNGAILPVLTAGQSLSSVNLKIRVTFTTTTASRMCGIDNLIVRVLQAYSSSGTRISPALSLAAAVRAGATLTAWNAAVPTNTSLLVQTSINGGSTYQTSGTSGSAISGITSQPNPTYDTFAVDTHTSYTSTNQSGGTPATLTWDTANSRLKFVGGTNALLLVNALTGINEVSAFIDLSQADAIGLVLNYQNSTNFFYCEIHDNSASSNPGMAYLNNLSGGSLFLIGSSPINFPRGTYHRFQFAYLAGIFALSLDGVQIVAFNQNAFGLPPAGQVGLWSKSGTSFCTQVYVQPQGQNVSALSVLSKITLSSTDPTVSPQLLDLICAALSPDIGVGALIPSKDYRNVQVNKVFDDVVGASTDSTWFVRPDKSLVARARTADPAPWILTGDDTQIVDPPHISNNGDHYRNREIIINVSSTVAFTDRQTGDGQTRTWTLKFKLVSAPVVLLNGQSATIGLKGGSGSNFYYEVDSDTLTQDNAGTILESNVDFLDITATGATTTTVVRNNTGAFPGTVSQSQFATITGGGTGIVADVVDGTGMTVAQAQTFGDGLLQEMGKIGRTVQFKTERGGLKAGQWLTAINPKLLLNDASLLITKVGMSYWTSASGGTMQFQVEASEGPVVGSWQKVIESSLKV